MTVGRSDAGSLAIDLTDVRKTYRGRVHALRGIDMQVHRGEIFGLLGPNGAGKSTLVKILMTVIRPTVCKGVVLGHPVGHRPTLARIGYLPEHHTFAPYLTGAQVLDFYASMANVPGSLRRQRAGALLETMGIAAWANKRVKGYSKGMRQRLGIAQSLMNDPEIVLLDEPTDGVDPVGRRDIREILVKLREQGKTVLVNSHMLSELEMVCDRVAILVKGKVVAQGRMDDLTKGQQRYEIEFSGEDGAEARAAIPEATAGPPDGAPKTDSAPWTGALATGEPVAITPTVVVVGTTEAARIQPVIDRLRGAGVTIRAVRPIRPSLEDLFMRAVTDPETGRTLKPGAPTKGDAA